MKVLLHKTRPATAFTINTRQHPVPELGKVVLEKVHRAERAPPGPHIYMNSSYNLCLQNTSRGRRHRPTQICVHFSFDLSWNSVLLAGQPSPRLASSSSGCCDLGAGGLGGNQTAVWN